MCVYLVTGGLHAVGLTALSSDTYKVCTWSPFSESEPVTVEEIFPYLDKAPRVRKREGCGKKTLKTGNIVALPPERWK